MYKLCTCKNPGAKSRVLEKKHKFPYGSHLKVKCHFPFSIILLPRGSRAAGKTVC